MDPFINDWTHWVEGSVILRGNLSSKQDRGCIFLCVALNFCLSCLLEVVFMRLYIGVLILSRLKLIAKSCSEMESQKIESTNLDQSRINRYNWGIVGLAHKWLHRAASRKKKNLLTSSSCFKIKKILYFTMRYILQ